MKAQSYGGWDDQREAIADLWDAVADARSAETKWVGAGQAYVNAEITRSSANLNKGKAHATFGTWGRKT